jgi:hypothetical protein
MPEPDFEPKQILIVHPAIWRAMQNWAADHKFLLARIPDGADEEGVPFYREDKPEGECEQCGHTPTYGFMPSDELMGR